MKRLAQRLRSNFSSEKSRLNINNMNQTVLTADYAIRGSILVKAKEIQKEIESGSSDYNFDMITECNIGNPQIFGQKPISFSRNVLACLTNPDIMDSFPFHKDVINRAKLYREINKISIGAYSDSLGYEGLRKRIASALEKRDGFPANPNHIMMTAGASNGISLIMQAMLNSPKDGIMIPIPQYPFYLAAIKLNRGAPVPYFLNENDGWQITVEDLEKSLEKSKAEGVNVKAIVLINPGNPTGQILKKETMKGIVEFCQRNSIVILADEVYQQNIYKEGAQFHSFKKVICESSGEEKNVQLISFHSTSKGIVGECGFRGGYMEALNIDSKVWEQMVKLKSIFICSNTPGQYVSDLMMNPPSLEDCTQETVEKYNQEYNSIFESLKSRAANVTEMLNQMKNIESNEIEGAMYAFPRLILGDKAIAAAKESNLAPDAFYCFKGILYFSLTQLSRKQESF